MMESALTHARLLETIHYDCGTGIFTWRIAMGWRGGHKVGTVCGGLDIHSGYVKIGIDKRRYWAHRLAWFYVYGAWPEHQIDHRDTIRHHNWIDNLRHLTQHHNAQNISGPRSWNKSSGVLGVIWDAARGRWKVHISINNRSKFLGRFDDLKEAESAYIEAKRKYHPGSLL